MPSNSDKEVVLVTGATNGIGLDTVIYIASASTKYHVIIGARNMSKGETVLKDVQAKAGIQGTLSLVQLDANDDASIKAAAKKIEEDFSKLDVLINNAGICPERDGTWPDRELMRTTFETNVFGPTILTEALIPAMKRSSNPRIINVSSTMGSITLISDHSSPYSQIKYPGYRMTKAALNMLTAYQYTQLKPDGFKVWTYCPGYVVTDLGDDREQRKEQNVESSETSALGLLQIVQGERDADVGGFVGRYGQKYESALASKSDIRFNHIQVVGTHNSYHREVSLAERPVFEKYVPSPEDYYYSHAELDNQLEYQSVRSFELDLHSDEKGGLYYPPVIWTLSNLTNVTTPYNGDILKKPGIKVFHVTDFDPDSVCHTFIDCLKQLKSWSDANPRHVPITIDLELKTDAPACSLGGVCPGEATNWTLPRLLNVDAEILSVFPKKQLIRPDDVRKSGLTLEQSILQQGWPKLKDVRGRLLFFFDNDPKPSDPNSPRELYKTGAPSLQNRTVFTNALEGSSDAAFIKYNEPRGNGTAEIQRLVKKGYLIRTRADIPIDTILNRTTEMRDLAFQSGAQIVSTDFPAWGMSSRWGWDYVARLPGGLAARCNPLIAPEGCKDKDLE
ncbi:hypothetical protein J4E93_000139 [Alternaria ventricosa]|uniref:uncharacterized protein n=1 Tax=Alternaria ventricosa TaxID=1187951 RepID=UPI0020C50F8B|nr:uncharacterized protein J4E93_000139 [Alternaria ventricosa]KAI4655427.1 hypothetical protein J4E93_000139 [Alternaria ventricosa]